ncbi:MAG: hypothetical protein ACR2HD_10785 [Solirubrobacteraceae bacterium]
MRRTAGVAIQSALIAGVLAGVWLIVDPPSTDLAAHLYRAQLFTHHGFVIWDGQWYGGHHTPAYSVIYPPLAALIGVRLVGALSAPLAAAAFGLLATRTLGTRARWGALWFAAATLTSLLSGRLPFAAGTALGLCALASASYPGARAGALAIAFALACTLTSPVAGLFLALAGAAWLLASRRLLGLGLAIAALAPIAVLTALFPEGGHEPFAFGVFWPAAALAVGLAAVAAAVRVRGTRVLVTGSAIYLLACIAAYWIHTPLGSNTSRLAALVAGPLIACLLLCVNVSGSKARLARATLAALVVPALWFQWNNGIKDVRTTWGDPATKAAYYQPLLDFLASRPGPFRIEIPFTVHKFEAAYVAPRFPLARGWERQLDYRDNALFYDPGRPLTAANYASWLDAAGVGYVALPDAQLDYSAFAEAELLRTNQVPGLREVFHSAHWIVWQRPSARLVVGAGQLVSLGVDSFTLAAGRPGPILVRERDTPYWTIAQGSGCVGPARGGWTLVTPRRPERLRIDARFSFGRVLHHGPNCRA